MILFSKRSSFILWENEINIPKLSVGCVGGTQLKTTGGGQLEEVSVKREQGQTYGPVKPPSLVSSMQESFDEGDWRDHY